MLDFLQTGEPLAVFRALPVRSQAEVLGALDQAYFSGPGQPLVSDQVYDTLKDHFVSRHPNHPAARRVGAPGTGKVTLPVYMGSLNKVKDTDPAALRGFAEAFPGEEGFFWSEKLDGISALLVLASSGAHLYTRGDGTHGQDVSHLLPSLALPPVSKAMVLRGELILSKPAFARHGSEQFKTARNMVAALVNMNVGSAPAPLLRLLQFRVYSVLQPPGMPVSQQFQWARRLGFQVAHGEALPRAALSADFLLAKLSERKALSEFDIDGLVVAHDAFHGVQVGKNPDHALAFKSLQLNPVAEVAVTGVQWNVSKDGYLKPVVLVTPVVLGGVTISRATGFNAGFVEQHGLGPGARVLLTRSGDVIPHIVTVLAGAKPQLPEDVPFLWDDTHKNIRVADLDGDAQRLRGLQHFFDTVRVPGFSHKSVEKVFAAGFQDAPAVAGMAPQQLAQALPGLALARAGALLASMRHAIATAGLVRLMLASNCFGHGLGPQRLEALSLAAASLPPPHTAERLSKEVAGVSAASAQQFLDGLPAFQRLQRQLLDLGITTVSSSPEQQQQQQQQQQLQGQVVVLTGFRDAALEAQLARLGAKVASSVTQGTTLVVAKDVHSSSGKLQAARNRGVPVLSLQDFLQQFTPS